MEYLITMEDGTKALAHYGVKGMKWGVRKAKPGSRRELANSVSESRKKLRSDISSYKSAYKKKKQKGFSSRADKRQAKSVRNKSIGSAKERSRDRNFKAQKIRGQALTDKSGGSTALAKTKAVGTASVGVLLAGAGSVGAASLSSKSPALADVASLGSRIVGGTLLGKGMSDYAMININKYNDKSRTMY